MKLIAILVVICGAAFAQDDTYSGKVFYQYGQAGTQTFSAEKLSPAEILKLNGLRDAAKKAADALAVGEAEVRQAHGSSSLFGNGNGGYSAPAVAVCTYSETTVEIRGDWALVTKTNYAQCH